MAREGEELFRGILHFFPIVTVIVVVAVEFEVLLNGLDLGHEIDEYPKAVLVVRRARRFRQREKPIGKVHPFEAAPPPWTDSRVVE